MSSRFPDKYIIGLTGNIATGKSVVRKMLDHLGAFGIDADRLSHAAMAKGAPAYAPVVRTFGQYIVGADGEIDRKRLGTIVFSDANALSQLEGLVHPIVRQALEMMIKRAKQKVIVVEAIKLLEGDLVNMVDSIWVTDAPTELQAKRLITRRNMPTAAAHQRIAAQNSQADKLSRAHVVIKNAGSVEDTWKQVQAAWNALPLADRPTAAPQPVQTAAASAQAVTIRRCGPADSAKIAEFINKVAGVRLSRVDVLEAFGEKAYLAAEANGRYVALTGWQVDNLVTRVSELYLHPNIDQRVVLPLVEAVEEASRALQSEAALVFLPTSIAQTAGAAFKSAGYALTTVDDIGVAAWREAIKESQPKNTQIMFKKLREDRVLRPL